MAQAEDEEILNDERASLHQPCDYGGTMLSYRYRLSPQDKKGQRGEVSYQVTELARGFRIRSGASPYLLLDDLKLHYDKKINEWLEVHKQKIQVFLSASLFSRT